MNRDFGSYHSLLCTIRGLYPEPWMRLFEGFEHLTLKERKAGILLFRARQIPDSLDSTLSKLTTPFFKALQSRSTDIVKDVLFEIVENPDSCSIALSLLLSTPYDIEGIQSIYSTMISKEMTAMESEARESTINWHNLLSADKALHPDFRPAPNTNRMFRQVIQRWIRRLSSAVILPFSSTRSLSKETLRRYNEYTENEFESISPLQLEQHYSSTGVKIGGPCEMRQVWYPTNATPRTYYAMGGEAYFKSRYLRDVFNYLADYFPATNRFTRVDPSHLKKEPDEDAFIYDLTSFTSMFHEQRYFLDFLADIVEGVEVQILDTYTGVCSVSLSDLIREYNDMNKQPQYSLERIGTDLVLNHAVAGFLGVYGNLMTCTIPHGICLMTIRDTPMKEWCAGDDAGVLGKREDESFDNDTWNMLNTIGSAQWEKLFKRIENDAKVALKRQMVQLPSLLFLQPNMLFPPFSTLFKDDPRFSRYHGESMEDRVSRFCSGLSSMFYQMSLQKWNEGDITYLKHLLPHIYRRVGLPLEGWFPPLCGRTYAPGNIRLSFSVPRLLGDFWREDPTKMLLDAYMPRFFDGTIMTDTEWDGVIGDYFECRSTPLLNLASKLGFFNKEVVRVTYMMEVDVRAAVYREYLTSRANSKHLLYSFTKIVEPPLWL